MNKSSFFIILFLLVFSQCLQADDHIDQSLEGLDGAYHPMSNYLGQGKWVVVNVWSPTCSACVQELPTLRSFHSQYSSEIDVLGVTLDYPSFAYGKMGITKKFLNNNPLAYPIFLADHESASHLIDNYLVAIPLVALFHPDGRAVARWPGPISPAEILEFIAGYDEHYVEDPFQ